MARQKRSELSTGAQVDNVICFIRKENNYIQEVKNNYNLKQCGVTKMCIESKKENVYNCECFQQCAQLKNIFKINY